MASGGARTAAIDRESFGSADVFTAIEDHVARNPELVAKVGKVFVFKLTSPDSAWTIDVKNGKGSVQAGAGAADTTLELTDADFLAMTSGKADAMKLYMGGKLKIGGDVMASQKLSFLQKIDPKHALEAVTKKRGGGERGDGRGDAGREDGVGTARRSGRGERAPRDLQGPRGAAGEEPRPREGGRRGPAVQRARARRRAGSSISTGAGAVREGTDAKADDGAAHRRRRPGGALQGPEPVRATSTNTASCGSTAMFASPTSSDSSRTSIYEGGDAMARRVNVIGVGMTKFAKPGQSEDYHVMAAKAAHIALADAKIPYEAVEQVYAGYVYGDSTCGQRAAYEVGLTGCRSST